MHYTSTSVQGKVKSAYYGFIATPAEAGGILSSSSMHRYFESEKGRVCAKDWDEKRFDEA